MDFLGMLEREKRKEMKFTVLRRGAVWTQLERDSLADKSSTEVHGHADHPGVIIMKGEYSRDQIVAFIGEGIGVYSVVQGYDNPELPFRPSLV